MGFHQRIWPRPGFMVMKSSQVPSISALDIGPILLFHHEYTPWFLITVAFQANLRNRKKTAKLFLTASSGEYLPDISSELFLSQLQWPFFTGLKEFRL